MNFMIFYDVYDQIIVINDVYCICDMYIRGYDAYMTYISHIRSKYFVCMMYICGIYMTV